VQGNYYQNFLFVNMKKNGVAVIAFLSIIFFLSGCMKQYSIEGIVLNSNAIGSLKDSTGNCLPITPYGTYYKGIAPGDTNYIQISVNIKRPGTYTIKSDLQNGFQFSGTGIFSDSGVNTIKLTATGTPIKDSITNFILSFDTSACMFSVNVHDSTDRSFGGPLLYNTWRFLANGKTPFQGPLETSQFITASGGSLSVAGTMQSGSTDTIFAVTVQFPSAALTTGTFATSVAGTSFAFEKLPNGNVIYGANATVVPPVINIVITNYDAVNKVVTGTFSGNAFDATGNTVQISDGGFIAQLQ
jgi:hypothetical protein